MLLKRVVSSFIALIILAIALLLDANVFAIGVTIITLVATYEFINTFKKGNYSPISSMNYIFSVVFSGIVFFSTNKDFFTLAPILFLAILMAFILILSLMIFKHKTKNIVDVLITIFGILYVPLFFVFLTLIRNLDYGVYLVVLVFVIASSSDTFAYFVGKKFGKIKLIPQISPKKTVEGAIGGVLGSILVTVLYGYIILDTYFVIEIYHYIIIALIGSVFSQFGDLVASSIKRFVDVKDFGNIMPGHGGVLDRFDGIIFISPIVYLYCVFLF